MFSFQAQFKIFLMNKINEIIKMELKIYYRRTIHIPLLCKNWHPLNSADCNYILGAKAHFAKENVLDWM